MLLINLDQEIQDFIFTIDVFHPDISNIEFISDYSKTVVGFHMGYNQSTNKRFSRHTFSTSIIPEQLLPGLYTYSIMTIHGEVFKRGLAKVIQTKTDDLIQPDYKQDVYITK